MKKELEIKRKQAELMRVQSSKLDIELKILERMDEIERMKDHLKIQDEKVSQLEEELKQL